ncbi:MAG: SDR family NAD(P)-dependent oxidoreductase [Kiloniellales bacterium]
MIRTAVVTGASRGIGRAIAARLMAEGWRVYNLDIIQPTGDPDNGPTWVEVDLADEASIAAAFERVLADGPVTGLVNNAAIGRMTGLEDTTVKDFDDSVAVNMRAPMLCTKAVVPGMKAEGFGRIVSISSRAHLGKTQRTAYGGTKGAIVSMAKVWALELAGDGITSNVIAPGPIRTELFDLANPPDMPRSRQIIDAIPVGRMGEPEDVANAAAFFMDERAGYVTGQVLYVCGGITLARGGS